MRKLLLICLIVNFISSYGTYAQEQLVIDWDYSNQDFASFIRKAESVHNLKFFYKDEWIRDLNPGKYPGMTSLRQLLDGLFLDQSLFYFIDESGNVVITKYFAVKIPGLTDKDTRNYLQPAEYYDQEDEQELTGNLVYDIGNQADRYKPGNVVINGYITDRDTREPVAGVTVYVAKLQKGTASNQYGYYSISLPRGNHQVQFSYIGMKEKQVSVNLFGPGELNIEMNSVLIPIREAIITAQKSVTLQRYEVGLEKINITSFRLMPTSLGEPDIIKNVLLITGVQSVGEGSAGFNVRGGSADQNLILLYGAPVYNTSHLFGFFSAVNSDVISDVNLYKGGIPARYGGRIASVLDISAKDGNKREFAGNAGISPITTHLKLEGPLIRDTLSYFFSGRTTYSDYLLKLIDDPALNNSSALFYDVNGRISYDLNRNNKIDISGYLSHDSFRFNSDTLYSYENALLSARWRHFFTRKFISVFSFNNSNYNYNVSSVQPITEGFTLSHIVNSTGLKADFNWFPGRHEFNFGLDMTGYRVSPGNYDPKGDSSLVIPEYIRNERAVEAAIYFDDKFALTDKLSLNAGFRISSLSVLGPAEVMIYNPNFPKSLSTITDTLNYGRNELVRFYAGPEFRLSLNWKVSVRNSIKVNYNSTRQNIHLLSNTTTISPTDTWKLCDYYLKPQNGNQFAAGFYHLHTGNGMETSVEFYYKRVNNMVDFKGGTNLIMNDNIEKDLINVRGKAYGAEFSIRKNDGKLRWSLGYTWSRSFLQSTGKFSSEIINSGAWFPSNYDKPHDLVATMNFLYSRRLTFSVNYLYSTGRPITYPVSIYYMNGILATHYSDRNMYRIPDYSRLDVAWTISGNLKSRKIAHPLWTFSVYNLLSRANVYSEYFVNEYNTINGYRLSVFAQAIPTITFSFDF